MSTLQLLRFIATHPIASRNKRAAFERFVRWQLASRIGQRPQIVDWVGSAKLIVRRGETGLTGNIYTGLHEFSDMSYLLHALMPDDLFVDIGANAGSYTILAGSVARATVIAIEPVPETFQRLTANVQINSLVEHVQCLNLALGETSGQVDFSRDGDTVNHVVLPGEKEGRNTIPVPMKTLDEVLVLHKPALLKIDVEGYELSVLRGAEATLRSSSLRGLIVELNGSGNRYGHSDSDVVKLLQQAGFHPYRYFPFERRIQPLAMANDTSGNTLFLRNMEDAQRRVVGAQRIMVFGVEI